METSKRPKTRTIKADAGYRDPALGAKIEHLAGVTGYLFPTGHFNNKTLAVLLGVSEQRMTRMRSGKLPIDNQDLSKVLVHGRLDGLTVDDLKVDGVQAFDERLRAAGVGIHGSRDGDSLRQKWLAGASGSVTIEPLRTARAGLSAPEDSSRAGPQLRIGDKARLRFVAPDAGFILVLNDDCDRRELTCLAPSCYAPMLSVRAGTVTVPTKNPAIEPAFSVVGPPGWARIFAIWTRTPLACPWPDGATTDSPFVVTKTLANAIERAVDAVRSTGTGHTILVGDYQVI